MVGTLLLGVGVFMTALASRPDYWGMTRIFINEFVHGDGAARWVDITAVSPIPAVSMLACFAGVMLRSLLRRIFASTGLSVYCARPDFFTKMVVKS